MERLGKARLGEAWSGSGEAGTGLGKITLAGSMPPDLNNGLASAAKEFLAHPREARLIVGLVTCKKSVRDNDTGSEYPVLSVRHWELVGAEDQQAAATMLGKGLAARTGIQELPLEPGEEVPMKLPPFPDDDEFGPDELEK